MQTWMVAALLGLGLGVAGLVVGLVVAFRSSRERGRPSDLIPGTGPFGHGPMGPALLQRLGLSGLVQHATGVVAWQVGDRDAVAARTDGRGWATRRGSWTTSAATSGVAYSLVAVRLAGRLPTINVLRDGVIGSHVDVESGEFNRTRDIRTDDDRVAHAALTPRVIALLQDLPEDLTAQIVGDHLISFRRGVPAAEEVLQRGELLAEIADAIPAFLYDDR